MSQVSPSRPVRPSGWSRVRAVVVGRLRVHSRVDAGMNTAEYAVGTLAAVAFAGLLLKVLTSDAVRRMLADIVQRALQ
jgi:hypothetical protein